MSSETAEQPPRPGSRFGSLTFRINAWYACVLVLGLAALGALAMATIRREFEHDRLVSVEARLERHRVVLEQTGLPEYERAVAHAAELDGERASVRIRNRAGQTLFQQGNLDKTLVMSSSAKGNLQIEIAPGSEPWSRIGPRLRAALLLLLCGFLAMGLGGGVYLTRSALRPVAALAETARGVIDSGDLSRRVELEHGRGELAQLGLLMNGMLDRNQRLVRGMREALDNVAHDLRTPLARLRGVAEVALGSDDAAGAREALADCIEETDRVLVMLRTLMDISEAEAGIMRLNPRSIDVTTLARETVDLYADVAEEAGVGLTLRSGAPAPTVADGNRLRQALANLVDNAVKYTARGGTVEVAVERQGAEIEVRVRDTGCGIPAEALPRIWDRLYRVDPSRSERGLGLGLSLVRAIAVAHGGRVSVDSTPGRGSTFILAVPAASGGAPAERPAD